MTNGVLPGIDTGIPLGRNGPGINTSGSPYSRQGPNSGEPLRNPFKSLEEAKANSKLRKVEMQILPNNREVENWICKSVCSKDGNTGEAYLMFQRIRRAETNDVVDINMAAAERFMGCYEGKLSEEALILQLGGKHWRETSLAKFIRDKTPAAAFDGGFISMFFGRNGSSAEHADFTTKWGFMGLDHRKYGVKPGTAPSPIICHCEVKK
jgi:hypothetical protein